MRAQILGEINVARLVECLGEIARLEHRAQHHRGIARICAQIPVAQIGGGSDAQALAVVVRQRERQLRVGQRVMRHQVGDVITFGGFGFQKFAARRDVEEEVADFEFGAARKGYVAHIEQTPAADLDLGGPWSLVTNSRRHTTDIVDDDGFRIARVDREENAALFCKLQPRVVLEIVRRLRTAERNEHEWREQAIGKESRT